MTIRPITWNIAIRPILPQPKTLARLISVWLPPTKSLKKQRSINTPIGPQGSGTACCWAIG